MQFRQYNHTECIFRLLKQPENDYIIFDDWLPMLEELLA